VNKKKFNLFGLLADSNATSSIIAIILGLLVGFIFISIAIPAMAGQGIAALMTSGFANMRNFGQVLFNATPIIMTGLSVAFAGKTGLFNIGASGQFTMGGYLAILVGVRATGLSGPSLLIAATLAAIIGGAIWGAIPGILKAWRNVNEVITCIMMNYIGMFLVNYLIIQTVFDQTRNMTIRVQPNANYPALGLDKIFAAEGMRPTDLTSAFIVAIVVAILMFIILEKTTLGFELKACGFNQDAAKYAGISAKRGTVIAMTISGALAGLGGALFYIGGSNPSIQVVNVIATQGFDGIPVALLALNNPIGVIFSAIFLGYLSTGGQAMQALGFTREIVNMIIAVIIYFSALALLFKGVFQKINTKFNKNKEVNANE